jgi:glutamate-1-semialdehyde 2,1-aminomutase
MTRNATLAAALDEAKQAYAAANPASLALHQRARGAMPGGNTRSVLYSDPFPLAFARGEGARLWDVDGHQYTDLLGEFTAGVAGHSHPAIRRAVSEAMGNGISLGGHNTYEPRFAELVAQRFPAMQRLRFTNSGTEANLLAISLAVAATGRGKVMVFQGGYHGGVFVFSGGPNINAPFHYVVAPYNDTEAMLALIAENAATLAAVILEPMLGGGGCIPAEPAFLHALRAATERHGIVLILDEVMTSRLAPHGLGAELGVTPDLMTLGKYVGGGMSFGAFGGRAELMDRFDPSQPEALPHAGTFNNNVLTMAAGIAALTEVYPAEATRALSEYGDRLRVRLNAQAEAAGVPMCFSGRGSLLAVHMLPSVPRTPAESGAGNVAARDLFFFDAVRDGFWLARRGMMALSLPLTEADADAFAETVGEFIAVRGELLQ